MNGFLFEQIVFGPIKSRRLGISLGLNLLPHGCKHCTFNCLYCECGWTKEPVDTSITYPARNDIRMALEERLTLMRQKRSMLDNITFAGNGEPTLHPDFPGIVDDTIMLRDKFFPQAQIAVLSNASMAGDKAVAAALMKLDKSILKLDAGTEECFQQINNPVTSITLHEILENLKPFRGRMIIQSLFVRGTIKGQSFNNTTDREVSAWLQHIDMLRPRQVMIYSIARAPAAESVEQVSSETLQDIARKVEALGIETAIY